MEIDPNFATGTENGQAQLLIGVTEQVLQL